jgi:hypothetical protein
MKEMAMVKMFGFGGASCPRCERRHGAADGYCAGCGLTLGAPRHAPVLVDNRWMPGPDELAVFFGVRELAGVFVKTLRVPATARAFILQGERATEVPQGEYEIEGFFSRLNHLLRDRHAEILVTRSSALPVEFAFDDLPSAEHLAVSVRLVLQLRIENVPAFARHFMTMPGTIGAAQLRELLAAPLRQLAAEFVAARSLRDMAGRAALRPELDQHLQGGLALLLADYGLAVVRVETLALRHDRFDANRERIGSLWLAADDARVRIEHAGHLDTLYTEEEWRKIRREEQEQRLQFKRTELRQEQGLEKAELSLQNAERAHAIRTREIELYGRIVEARTRKQAIERGAQELVAELEHELAQKRGARLDQDAEWEHLRELAGLRMREEVTLAQADAAQARTVAAQRFTHQLLQQQIRNKVEQAQQIEDASRRRAELARLHDVEQDAARRGHAIDAAEHAGRLKQLELAHAARRRDAERAIEWDDAQQRQRIEGLETESRHDKLLRTIEADALLARREQEVVLEGERTRSTLRVEEQDAQRRHELQRMETLGALDDAAKLAFAPEANAAPLADLLKTRVQAGMDAGQLAALAGVTPQEAVRLARAQVDEERERREREVDKDRRHQLDLLDRQNDVNKAALATQASLGAGLLAAQAAHACRHAAARPEDRFCADCGAALPARG